MGSDNLFHKRKPKAGSQLARRKATRKPHLKVLIVCEGKKTEPNYFSELRDYFRLDSTFIKITGDCGSSPISVIKHAQELYKQSRDANDPFDQVYCVIDKDCHESYGQAINNIQVIKPKNTFILINSVPCFEYWLLLHFKYTTAPYATLPKNTPADQVLNDLKKEFSNYAKGNRGVFNHLLDRLDRAILHSKKALKEADDNGIDMPSTRVHILIEFLLTLQKE